MTRTPARIPVQTVTPYLVFPESDEAIAYYRELFGAEEVFRRPEPDGTRIQHAELRIGNSVVMLADQPPDFAQRPPERQHQFFLFVHVKEIDEVWKRALETGCEVMVPLADYGWGHRYGMLRDRFGHKWGLTSPIE